MSWCECNKPGICKRHNMTKTKTMYENCKKNRDVFLKYEVESGNIQEPSLLEKLVSYTTAVLNHAEDVDEETFQKRKLICSSCPLNVGNKCIKCGCELELKIRWKESECPDYPPRW